MNYFRILLVIASFCTHSWASPPVPYSGKVAIDGVNFFGTANFAFEIRDAQGIVHWRNGATPNDTISVSVANGRYVVQLGGQGMNPLAPELFLAHDELYLKVRFDSGDGQGLRVLGPDQRITATPYALAADLARLAQGVPPGSITREMLANSVLSDLNNSGGGGGSSFQVTPGSITLDLLSAEVLSDLNSSISLNRLSPEVLAALQVTPSISTQPFARFDWRTNSAVIEATGRGHNLSYQWLKDGQPIAGANAPVLELANPTLDDNATYAVRLTNSVGQATSQTLTLQQAVGAPGPELSEANATQVPRNGLALWMDANDLDADGHADNILTGSGIETWTDKVSEKNATQNDPTKLPLYSAYGLIFDHNDFLQITDLNVTAQHLFIVSKVNQGSGQILVLQLSGGGGKVRVSNNSINTGEWYDYSRSGTKRISRQEDTFGVLSLKGIPFLATLTPNGTKLVEALNIGGFSSNTSGAIMEILLYNRILENLERNSIENFLMSKWDLPTLSELSPQNEPENGLEAYYKLNSDELHPNRVWDYSGNDRHLTRSGFDGDPWVDGAVGDALSFDGVNDYLQKGQSNFSFKFLTVAFWAKPSVSVDGRNDPNPVFYTDGPGNSDKGRSFYFNYSQLGGSGHWMLQNHSGGGTFLETNTSQAMSLNGWLHIGLVATQPDGSTSYDFYLNGSPVGAVSSASSIGFINGDANMKIGSNNTGSYFYQGRLDEFRIYDRILAPAEIEALYNSYQNPLLRMAPEHNATVGTNFSLSLTADNGPTTYLAEGLPAGLSLNVTTGQITGTLSQPGYHRVFVKAMNEHGTGSDVIAIVARPQTDQNGWPVDVPDGSDIPQNGMVLWLDANDVDADGQIDTGTDHLKLANWADKADHDHNATQATAFRQPQIRSGQITGKPNLSVLVFDGNQSLTFPTISQGRTFFWVLQTYSSFVWEAQFFSLNGSNAWGTNSMNRYFSGATTEIANGSGRRDGDAIHLTQNNQFSHFNLQVCSLLTTDFISTNLISKAGTTGNYFIGKIGEILVYDRALTETEIETVEKYLGQKWGISISHDTPPISGDPPTLTLTPANDSVTTAHLTEQILKYLKPEITAQPQSIAVANGGSTTLVVNAEGKFLTYQWSKDNQAIGGETNATIQLSGFNEAAHEGNYTVSVSNDFGTIVSDQALVTEQ